MKAPAALTLVENGDYPSKIDQRSPDASAGRSTWISLGPERRRLQL
jgi:hypothetical protein